MRILIADAEPDIAGILSSLLKQCGHETLAVQTGHQAQLALVTWNPSAVLLDLRIRHGAWWEVMNAAVFSERKPATIILSAPVDAATEVCTGYGPIIGMIAKPVRLEPLMDLLEKAERNR